MSVQESSGWHSDEFRSHRMFQRNRARKARRAAGYVPTIADAMLSQADRHGVADAAAIDATMDEGVRLSDWEGLR